MKLYYIDSDKLSVVVLTMICNAQARLQRLKLIYRKQSQAWVKQARTWCTRARVSLSPKP